MFYYYYYYYNNYYFTIALEILNRIRVTDFLLWWPCLSLSLIYWLIDDDEFPFFLVLVYLPERRSSRFSVRETQLVRDVTCKTNLLQRVSRGTFRYGWWNWDHMASVFHSFLPFFWQASRRTASAARSASSSRTNDAPSKPLTIASGPLWPASARTSLKMTKALVFLFFLVFFYFKINEIVFFFFLKNIAMPHQWMEGNLPVSAKCSVCDKTCGSVLRLQDWRCLWCRAMVHTACRPQYPVRCPLGPCRVSIVPPTALHSVGTVVRQSVFFIKRIMLKYSKALGNFV